MLLPHPFLKKLPQLQKKNPYAVLLGRRGGLKCVKARAEKLSSARQIEIARKAALARWGSRG